VSSPHLAGLRTLRLPSNNLGNEGLHALAQSATLMALEELDYSSLARHERYIHDPVIRAAAMGALMNWAGLARVRSLTLSGNDVSRDGLRALLRSPHAASLKVLSLRDGQLDGQAMAEFDSAVSGLQLEMLDLGENVLKDVGAEYVAIAPCLRELKALRLDRCEITLSGARRFAKKASFMPDLRILDVGHNHFGPAGLADLLGRKPPALHTLQMRDNDLFDKGAKLLADSPASDPLLEIDLSQNGLGNPAALTLGESVHLSKLLILRLADNTIGESAANVLANSPLGRRLSVLELENL
jgi:Ran GTPase-activating protein (RanGAP) involved in mRNA processing and transport